MTKPQRPKLSYLASRVRLSAVAALLSRATAITSQILVVPLSIEIVGRELYGAFLVLTSLLAWIALTNLGLGSGMTTSLAGSIAAKRHEEARKLISSTLALLAGITLVLTAFLPFVGEVSWSGFLGVGELDGNRFAAPVRVGIALTAIGLSVSAGERILAAQQRTHLSHFLNVGASLLVIGLLFLLRNSAASLALLTACIIGPRVLSQGIGLSIGLWDRNLRPRLSDVDRGVSKRVLRVGAGFFLAQLASIAMWQTDNVIVGQLFGAETVAAYATTFRASVIVSMLVSAALSGVWPAVAAALAQGNIEQINRWRRLTIPVVLAFATLSSLTILLFGDETLRIWTGGEIEAPPGMLLALAVHIPTFAFCVVQAMFLNGLNRVRGQAIYGTTAAVLNLVLSLVLGPRFGPQGVCWATVLSSLVPALLSWWELRTALRNYQGPAKSKAEQ